MVELFRTNDPVLVSWMTARLADLEVEAVVFDQHASVMEGSINAIQRRVMVHREDLFMARQVVREAAEIDAGLRDPLD